MGRLALAEEPRQAPAARQELPEGKPAPWHSQGTEVLRVFSALANPDNEGKKMHMIRGMVQPCMCLENVIDAEEESMLSRALMSPLFENQEQFPRLQVAVAEESCPLQKKGNSSRKHLLVRYK